MALCTLKAVAPCGPFFTTKISTRRQSLITLRCSAEQGIEQPTAPSSQFITLTIKKPLGIVLSEKKSTGEVFVEEVAPKGNAAATGKVEVGDVIVKTSATVLKSGKEGSYEREGYGQRVYDNWEMVEFDCTGQSFDVVLAAIGSNNERWGINKVTLTLRRDPQ